MHRLRTTFTRSRTPTGADMKTQSSLEVPKQIRSASFDEIQFDSRSTPASATGAHPPMRQHQLSVGTDDGCGGVSSASSGDLLTVPPLHHYQPHLQPAHQPHLPHPSAPSHNQQRSRSFDSTGAAASAEATDERRQLHRRLSSLSRQTSAAATVSSFCSSAALQPPPLTPPAVPPPPPLPLSAAAPGAPGHSSASSTSPSAAPYCIHCLHLAEYERQTSAEQRYFIDHNEVQLLLSYRQSARRDSRGSDDSSSSEEAGSSASSPPPPHSDGSGGGSAADSEAAGSRASSDNEEMQERPTEGASTDQPEDPMESFGHYLAAPTLHSPGITFTLSPTTEQPAEAIIDLMPAIQQWPLPATAEVPADEQPPEAESAADGGGDSPDAMPPPEQTRQRRRSISRQEAVFAEPTESSLENVAAAAAAADCVQDIFLAVPDLKRDRAASVDSCFTRVSSAGKTEVLRAPPEGAAFTLLTVPQQQAAAAGTRSRSVDIVLPTTEQARYKALSLTAAAPGVGGEYPRIQRHSVAEAPSSQQRQPRQTPDWSEHAVAGDHLWSSTSISVDFCFVGDNECTKQGHRLKCSSCKIIVHTNCLSLAMQKNQLLCKPTFRDVGVRQYREQTTTHHHWVHRRSEKGKCHQCGKALQAKLCFSSKEIVAIGCSWCKQSYHNKESCFNAERIGEECSLGAHAKIVVPPSWIVKLPRGGGFKSSLRKQGRGKNKGDKGDKGAKGGAKKDEAAENKADKAVAEKPRTFIIKSIPNASVTPVLVFINPKSGGNQGVKLMQKFQWLLNPRQVFDLTQGGPNFGLELFSKTPQLRVLACGGDGTVGWVLSILDKIGLNPAPPVGVLPLGTGNDLARALGWGGGYTDEPIGKILANIADSDTILLDRWSLDVTPNPDAAAAAGADDGGKDTLPLNVVNNYFSFGVDAHIALEFHEAREAHPEKFNSRLRNKMFYGTAGGKDLLRRKWKGLAELVTLECDGKDVTAKLKEHRVHAIVFLNIQSYGGGTHPWNNSGGQFRPATDDGMIEVVGLTTYQLPLLQAGGHGSCIAQCKTARIVTSKTIPMQVDGEAAKLKPSIIEISLLNKAVMLAKKKKGRENVHLAGLEPIPITMRRITMGDYDRYHYDKELLVTSAIELGQIEVNPISDLENVRGQINKCLQEKGGEAGRMSQDWCFVDSCTAERFFRIDRAQEHLHYITDIAQDNVYLLDPDATCSATAVTATATADAGCHNDSTATSAANHHHLYHAASSGSSDNLDSRAGTPSSPSRSRSGYQRSVSGGAGSSVASLSPLPGDVGAAGAGQAPRKCSDSSLGSPGSEAANLAGDYMRNGTPLAINFHRNLLEKTSDGILKAARTGDLVLLKELHTQGYSLLSIDSTGQTALHHGSKNGHRDIVKYLISYAPNSVINMVDNARGQTALHKAASSKHRGICYMLVAAGGNLGLRDADGQTPMMLAFQANDHDLAAYLESQEKFLHMDYGPMPT